MLGVLGTIGSLCLRLGQTIFAVASLLLMCLNTEFYGYTAFCFLVTIMGLVIPWSLTLALADVLSVYAKPPFPPPGILSIVVVGDWVLSLLSLAASCSAASVTDFLLGSGDTFCIGKLCTRYQVAAGSAFLSWLLLLSSTLLNLWLLCSV
ncbi:CASP-like protein 5c1 [Phtheirospermum japonicum]|uniref:CASP-like protein n=1 Tax=Phtheirospermum japonicum TaxID=374723 RepID=A0A830CWH1_9LAMI|nr:CASP-like protein 5c1 [Phtheirospermum japonicum]